MSVLAILTSVLLCFAGPAPARKVTLTTSPVQGGRIFLNGDYVGVAPVDLKLRIKRNEVFVATAEKQGALGLWPRELTKDDLKLRTIQIRLEADRAFNETVEIDIANRWMTIEPRYTVKGNGSINEDLVWQKIVSLVTDNFSDVEQMDRASFYLRTAWRLKKYPYNTLRHRLVVKKGVSSGFSIKVMIESQVYVGSGTNIPSDRFKPIARIFPDDKDTIEFLRDQL